MRVFAYVALAALASTGGHAFYPYDRSRLPTTVGDDGLDQPSLLDQCMADLERSGAPTTTDHQDQIVSSPHPTALRPSFLSWMLNLDHAFLHWFRSADDVESEPSQLPSKVLVPRAPAPTYTFDVVSAVRPTQTNSLPIDQDGTDFSYFSTVKVGSAGKELHMLIDTGAPETWVMSANCTTRGCGVHNTFGKADSSTLVTSDKTWNVTYGTGQVGGVIGNDTFSFAGLNITLAFGLATNVSDEFLTYPIDGILGFGRPKPDDVGVRTLWRALKAQANLRSNSIGVSLQRQFDNINNSVITFGDVDRSKIQGDLTWLPIVNRSGVWEVRLDDAGADGKDAHFTGKTAIIDTGSSFTLLPFDDAKRFHALIPGVQPSGEEFRVPCTTNTEMHFTFAGVRFVISPDDYVGRALDMTYCRSNILGSQPFGPDRWLLGDMFLKNVYTVFDWDQNRVGFAHKLPYTAFTSSAASASSSGSASRSSSSPSSNTSASSTVRSTIAPTISTDGRASDAASTAMRNAGPTSANAGSVTAKASARSAGARMWPSVTMINCLFLMAIVLGPCALA